MGALPGRQAPYCTLRSQLPGEALTANQTSLYLAAPVLGPPASRYLRMSLWTRVLSPRDPTSLILSFCVCQASDISSSTFADGELLPREPGFFQEDEEEAMTLALPEGPQELEMDTPMESSQGLEGSGRSPGDEKEPELGGLFLPEDK